MKILFYRNDWAANASRQADDAYGGVGYYRIVQPCRHIKGHEVKEMGVGLVKKGETGEQRWTRIFKEYDVFWTSYFSDPHLASEMYYHRDKFGKKVVMDIDDNYLDVAQSHILYDRFKPQKRDRAFLSTVLSFADVITVSTEPLRQRLEQHLKKVYNLEKKIVVIPNMNQLSDWSFPVAGFDEKKIVIGYAGSNSHYDDLAMFLPHLAKIMDKYKNVHFEIMGSVGEKDAIKLFADFSEEAQKRCDMLPPTWTFPEYTKKLSEMKWDIAVAPLVDSPFTRCKSHIKFMEYSMYKIPTIASKVYPYYAPCFDREIIMEDETGILVQPSEWFDAMEDLVLNKNKRIKLGENAHKHISENWQYNQEFSDRTNEVIKALN